MSTNPFATRFIQPGAIAYERFDGGSVADLAEQFLKLPSNRALIFGPHGSGKSTLVASLVREWNRLQPELLIHSLRFSTNESPTRSLHLAMKHWTSGSIVVLDGFEQLKFWSRIKVAVVAKQRSIRILATAHRRIRGFDVLWETSVSPTSSHWVVEQLLQISGGPDTVADLLKSREWEQSRARHGQNLRESLFDMYDWWQMRHRR